MKEKIIAGIATSTREASLVTAGFTAPVWMQMLNAYMGFLIGVFTLIFVVWRVVKNMPDMVNSLYEARHRHRMNWDRRKEEEKSLKKGRK